jgi:hypothetical protein
LNTIEDFELPFDILRCLEVSGGASSVFLNSF